MSSSILKVRYGIDIRNWNSPSNLLFFFIGVLAAVHWGTVESLSRYWWNDSTYGHGLLLAPLSLYLIWRKRTQINSFGYAGSFSGLVLFLLLNLVWLAGYLIDVEVLQHVSLIVMITALLPALLGWRAAIPLLFPLLLPLIAMPLWSWLESPLQYITTHVVAFCLSIAGVPIFVEAHFIRIPEGEFSIEEVCAGLRYLMAALAISLVYAHLYLKKTGTKSLFLIFSVVLALSVNWVRVFCVIVAGHLTNMQHSLVHDHANFGWWLFAFTLIPVFWFGNFLLNKEQADSRGNPEKEVIPEVANKSAIKTHITYILASIVIIAVAFPLSGYYLKNRSKHTPTEGKATLAAPKSPANWQGPLSTTKDSLKPYFQGADGSFAANYIKNGKKVLFYTANYQYQEQGKELIFWKNRLFDHSLWKVTSKSTRQITLGDGSKVLQIEENVLRHPLGGTRVLWYWYSVAGVNTVKPAIAKILAIKDLFSKERMGSSVFLVASDVDGGVEHSRKLLTEFLRETKNIPGM